MKSNLLSITAKAWEIMVTEAFKEQAKDVSGVSFEELPDAPPGASKAYKVNYQL